MVENMKCNFNLEKIEQNSIQIIRIQGELLYQYIEEAKDNIDRLELEKNESILDLSKLTNIDSVGMGLVISLSKKISCKNKMTIVINDEYINTLFTIAKFNKIFDIVDSVEEAVEAIKKNTIHIYKA